MAAARARGRDGEGAEWLGEGVEQLVWALVVAGELGIGITVVCGCSGWKESVRGRLGCGNRSEVRAARVDAIPARGGSSGLEAGAVGCWVEWEWWCGAQRCLGGLLIGRPRGGRG